mmetsp:Transcript_32711/g.71985  ORF Transcript_32711/g.71985 Transcript_32711/m.71985 type:complete len:245 (-) Transcript_32711:880-1614(-)
MSLIEANLKAKCVCSCSFSSSRALLSPSSPSNLPSNSSALQKTALASNSRYLLASSSSSMLSCCWLWPISASSAATAVSISFPLRWTCVCISASPLTLRSVAECTLPKSTVSLGRGGAHWEVSSLPLARVPGPLTGTRLAVGTAASAVRVLEPSADRLLCSLNSPNTSAVFALSREVTVDADWFQETLSTLTLFSRSSTRICDICALLLIMPMGHRLDINRPILPPLRQGGCRRISVPLPVALR